MTRLELTDDQVEKLRREHDGLRAEPIRRGWWIFGYWEYEVKCSCGWVEPRRIPAESVEIAVITDFLIVEFMDEHIEYVLAREGWQR